MNPIKFKGIFQHSVLTLEVHLPSTQPSKLLMMYDLEMKTISNTWNKFAKFNKQRFTKTYSCKLIKLRICTQTLSFWHNIDVMLEGKFNTSYIRISHEFNNDLYKSQSSSTLSQIKCVNIIILEHLNPVKFHRIVPWNFLNRQISAWRFVC